MGFLLYGFVVRVLRLLSLLYAGEQAKLQTQFEADTPNFEPQNLHPKP